MDQRNNFLALTLIDALEDERESDIYDILDNNENINPSYVPLQRGIAPLHYVCGMENVDLAVRLTKRFLECGADPNVCSLENMTPLHVAAIHGRKEIVRLLLEYGGNLDLRDDERKTPILYAIEECHFEVLQLMRDYIFLDKYEQRLKEQQLNTKDKQDETLPNQLRFDQSLERLQNNKKSTPIDPDAANETPKNQELSMLQKIKNRLNETATGKYTPNQTHYNYDVTSPYYINITHRRHKPQPKYPSSTSLETTEKDTTIIVVESSPDTITQPLNIFSLTKENLAELSVSTQEQERTRISLIEKWRERVKRSNVRRQILCSFDDVNEMVEAFMENDHLNFTNTELTEKPSSDSGTYDMVAPLAPSTGAEQYQDPTPITSRISGLKIPHRSLGQLIQRIAQAQLVEHQMETITPAVMKSPKLRSSPTLGDKRSPQLELSPTLGGKKSPQLVCSPTAAAMKSPQAQPPPTPITESSYQTVPELKDNIDINNLRSLNANDYYVQMTEAYVHTDDENGLVFYETKLLSNQGNGNTLQLPTSNQQPNITRRLSPQPDTTVTSQSTEVTLPLDYETDALRAELTTLGEPPGPITKSTKRLYIKRLVKYKRKISQHTQEFTGKPNAALKIKYSVELYRSVRSLENFEAITDYMKYDALSMAYFANHQNKRSMREGHLKQSFIYMLIDPRVSCNLPGESVYLTKFEVWRRFLDSIFYVGKGKTTRPYSHLYEAMKLHSRLHCAAVAKDAKDAKAMQMSIKIQHPNLDLFKSKHPPAVTTEKPNKKLERILDIWAHNQGVVCLHVFHNILPTEAYTREAAIIDALGLAHLTNVKRGDYYGPAQTWTMKEKKFMGIALLYKAMKIYLAEGESQLSPSDLI